MTKNIWLSTTPITNEQKVEIMVRNGGKGWSRDDMDLLQGLERIRCQTEEDGLLLLKLMSKLLPKECTCNIYGDINVALRAAILKEDRDYWSGFFNAQQSGRDPDDINPTMFFYESVKDEAGIHTEFLLTGTARPVT